MALKWILFVVLKLCFYGVVVRLLDYQSSSPRFKITTWLQGWLSLSSFRGLLNDYQEFWGLSAQTETGSLYLLLRVIENVHTTLRLWECRLKLNTMFLIENLRKFSHWKQRKEKFVIHFFFLFVFFSKKIKAGLISKIHFYFVNTHAPVDYRSNAVLSKLSSNTFFCIFKKVTVFFNSTIICISTSGEWE